MTAFAPKIYQQQVLDSVEAYFKACHELPSPSIAFTAITERLWDHGNAYNPLSGFPPDMPYFCLRVPTGGGKTWLAAKSVTCATLDTSTTIIVATRQAFQVEQARLDLESHAGRVVVRPVAITLTEKPDLRSVPKPVRDKVSWDGKLNTLTISTPLTEDEAASRVAVTDQYAFEFRTQAYAPSRDYDGRFGHFDFRKHWRPST